MESTKSPDENTQKNTSKIKKSKKKINKNPSGKNKTIFQHDSGQSNVGDNNSGKKSKRKLNEVNQQEKRSKKVKRKKKQKNQNITENADQKNVENKAKVLALQYLQQWKQFRNVWSFQKVRQVWLLKNMYDVDMVNSDDFEVLLEYLRPLKGLAKTTTLEKAEEMLKEQEKSESSEDEDDHSAEKQDGKMKLTDEQVDRIRKVIQILV